MAKEAKRQAGSNLVVAHAWLPDFWFQEREAAKREEREAGSELVSRKWHADP